MYIFRLLYILILYYLLPSNISPKGNFNSSISFQNFFSFSSDSDSNLLKTLNTSSIFFVTI